MVEQVIPRLLIQHKVLMVVEIMQHQKVVEVVAVVHLQLVKLLHLKMVVLVAMDQLLQ